MKIATKTKEHKVTEIHGIKFIGKSEYGEFYALKDGNRFYGYDVTHGDSTYDGNNYIQCVSCGCKPKELLPLTKRDVKLIKSCYTTDGLSSCEECGMAYDTESYDSNPGYVIAGDCSFVCRNGCFGEWLKRYGLDDYINQSNKALPIECAEALEKNKSLKFIRRYIGGMVDPGRGGYYSDGKHKGLVDNGQPDEVLRTLLEQSPNTKYVLSHDESGQFQTYWSVWQVISKPKSKKAKR